MDGITDSKDVSLTQHQETVKDREASHAALYRVTKSQTLLATEQQKQKHHTDKYVPQTEPVSLLVFFF